MSRRNQEMLRNSSLLLAGLILGLLLALGWSSQAPNYAAEVGRQSSTVRLSIEKLEREQQDLKATLAMLREELAQQRLAAAADTDRLEALGAELERQQLLAGLAPVQGPGVTVILDDSEAQIPVAGDPNAYIIHEHDLRDIVNVLWMAGSESIAINNERLVNSSSIYCVGSTVMVNDTRLSPPYRIQAIGNPRVQQDYLRNPSYLRSIKEKQRLYSLRFEVEARSSLTLPAYDGGFLVQYARPGD
ncbi:MAG: DUF881 domain-containing protein [Anaerolineae bacterium]|nr:DUF881 domain-containing protein [Anaerolineae bacterium]